jgi:aspartyl aminopeptidase
MNSFVRPAPTGDVYIDRLLSSFCAVEALIESISPESQAISDAQVAPANVNVIALFNHEEIGSVSSTGAESSLLPSLLNRLSPTPQMLHRSIARSFLLSADMAHGVHPNFASKHEENHKPQLNGGVVIKTNAKQRYASGEPVSGCLSG